MKAPTATEILIKNTLLYSVHPYTLKRVLMIVKCRQKEVMKLFIERDKKILRLEKKIIKLNSRIK